MDQNGKLAMQRREWDEMQRRGHVRYVLLNVLIWIGAFSVVNELWLTFGNLGWVHTSGISGIEGLIGGMLTGALWSELHWSDMKRKFRNPPPNEDWITRT
jgi:hypothetical protein